MPIKRFDDEGNRLIGIAKARNQRRKETWTPEQLEEKAKNRQEKRRLKRAQSFKPLTEEEMQLIEKGLADKSLKIRYKWQLNREEYCQKIQSVRGTKESRELTSKLSTELMSNERIREQISKKEAEYCKQPEVIQRLRTNTLKLFENENHRKRISQLSKELWSNPEIAKKIYNTHKKNNSFQGSKTEDRMFQQLVERFGKEDVIRQHKTAEYPFNCDFYIKSLDLYLEFQGNWTHGKHPFDSHNTKDLEKIQDWFNKSHEKNFKGKEKSYFKRAIITWTERDPLKRKVAKENNLNWKEFFTMEEFYEWFNTL